MALAAVGGLNRVQHANGFSRPSAEVKPSASQNWMRQFFRPIPLILLTEQALGVPQQQALVAADGDDRVLAVCAAEVDKGGVGAFWTATATPPT